MKVNPNVIYRCVADEHILIPIGTAAQGKSGMYALTEVGGEIWKLLSSGKELDEIVAILADEYDADVETICLDVKELIRKLEDAGLVTE